MIPEALSDHPQHLHLSDNLFPSGSVPASKIYARLRLRSSQFPGLTPHINETYSREEFEDLQQHCASRGVTVGFILWSFIIGKLKHSIW